MVSVFPCRIDIFHRINNRSEIRRERRTETFVSVLVQCASIVNGIQRRGSAPRPFKCFLALEESFSFFFFLSLAVPPPSKSALNPSRRSGNRIYLRAAPEGRVKKIPAFEIYQLLASVSCGFIVVVFHRHGRSVIQVGGHWRIRRASRIRAMQHLKNRRISLWAFVNSARLRACPFEFRVPFEIPRSALKCMRYTLRVPTPEDSSSFSSSSYRLLFFIQYACSLAMLMSNFRTSVL